MKMKIAMKIKIRNEKSMKIIELKFSSDIVPRRNRFPNQVAGQVQIGVWNDG